MRKLSLLLVPLVLLACERQPVAPDVAPELAASHETSELTLPDRDWYTAMPCLGYGSRDWPDAVHWTASWLKISFWYRFTPNGDMLQKLTAAWSDDLQFVTPGGDTWVHVANTYNSNQVVVVGQDGRRNVVFHEQLIFANATTGARMKITNRVQLHQNASGETNVQFRIWDCNLTRPGL